MTEDFALPVVSREEFRRRLAGLADPDRKIQEAETVAYREYARQLVICLCLVYGKELDRKTIWTRLDSGLQAACAKVSDGDTDRWLDILLDHVRANPNKVVALRALERIRCDLRRDRSHAAGFVRWVASRRYAVMAHGRAGWEEWKKANGKKAAAAALEVLDEGGTADESRAAAYEESVRALEDVDLSAAAPEGGAA